MKFYAAGEKSKAICESCKKLVSTTFAYKNVPFDDGSGEVKDILAAVCDECGRVIAIPAQSIPAIRNSRQKATVSFEVKLPAPYLEKLDIAALKIDPNATAEFRKYLFAFYAHKVASGDDVHGAIMPFSPKSYVIGTLDSHTPKRRWSFKVTPRLDSEIHKVMHETNMKKTDFAKAVIGKIDKEIVRRNSSRDLNELKRLAVVSAG